jgi:hypothetical protein
LALGPHLVEDGWDAGLGKLPGGFRARQSAADDVHRYRVDHGAGT